MAGFSLRRRFTTPDAANFGAAVRGRDGVHLRRGAGYEWCVRHRGEGIQYSIRELPGIFRRDDIAELAPRQHLVIDSGARHHGQSLARLLGDRGVAHWEYHVDGGESCKSAREFERLCHDILVQARRRDLVVAVGGGAVCDLVRCVAAWLWKGLPLAIVPTTATAYVDAGIGVKGALNRDDAKNCVGVYYPPLLVGLDLALIEGCSRELLCAGLMEILKMALIEGGRFWAAWERLSGEVLATSFQGPGAVDLTRLAITAMLKHLQPNLREHELRRPVDLGHLLVRLLEMEAQLLHGMAVGIDLALMAEYAAVTGQLAEEDRDRIHATIRALGAPIWHELITAERVADAVEATSRQRGGTANLPVPAGIGRVEVHEHVDGRAMREAVLRLRARGLGAGHLTDSQHAGRQG